MEEVGKVGDLDWAEGWVNGFGAGGVGGEETHDLDLDLGECGGYWCESICLGKIPRQQSSG